MVVVAITGTVIWTDSTVIGLLKVNTPSMCQGFVRVTYWLDSRVRATLRFPWPQTMLAKSTCNVKTRPSLRCDNCAIVKMGKHGINTKTNDEEVEKRTKTLKIRPRPCSYHSFSFFKIGVYHHDQARQEV